MEKDDLKLVTFNYKGKRITFDFGDGHQMVNASEIAKAFGKRLENFTRLKQTKDFIEVLETRMNAKPSDVSVWNKAIKSVRGGNDPSLRGIWYEKRLALKLAAWLSPEFEVWVFDKIEELLTTGSTSIEQKPVRDTSVIKAIRLIADQMEGNTQEIQKNKDAINYLQEFVYELEAKATAHDENYYSVAGYCALNGIPCVLKQAQKWGRAATILSNKKGFDIGEAHSEIYGRVGTYHKEILAEVLKDDVS